MSNSTSAGRGRVMWCVAATGALICAFLCSACAVPPPPALARLQGARAAPTATAHVARPGRPARIRIPAINLDWPVIPVGRDANGGMYTPQGPEDAPSWHEGFWWQYGYLVGQPGNAVIAGHVDDVAGNLTPFAYISQLQPGDAIDVTTDQGTVFHFVVTRVASVPNPVGGPTDPTIAAIFGPAQTPNLNLVTCTGNWVGNEFDERLVVYSTLAQNATPAGSSSSSS